LTSRRHDDRCGVGPNEGNLSARCARERIKRARRCGVISMRLLEHFLAADVAAATNGEWFTLLWRRTFTLAGNVDRRVKKKTTARGPRASKPWRRLAVRVPLPAVRLDATDVKDQQRELHRPRNHDGGAAVGHGETPSQVQPPPTGDRTAKQIPPEARVSAPTSHWRDWTNWGLGIWLCLSPTILGFSGAVATRDAVATGYLLILATVAALTVFRPWEEGIVFGIGVWLVSSPFVLGVTAVAATTNFIAVGLIAIVLAWQQISAAACPRAG
jgi:hypothetical protein